MNNGPIGVFDSGVGGLTVVSQIIKQLPNEEIIYFGDTARVPYGSRSAETILKYSMQSVRFLQKQHVKAIVVACNTISAICIDAFRSNCDIPIISVVDLQVGKECIKASKQKKIGVIGTERTIKSQVYKNLLTSICSEAQVYSKACPVFVPLAEECWLNNQVTIESAKIYLNELIENEIDTLLLGCTHYPLLADCIRTVVGADTVLVDPGKVAAIILKDFLAENNMLREKHNPNNKFFVSDNTEKFNTICSLVLNQNYNALKIDIDKY